jgi:predicted MFS family arabinose efflux permease
MAVNVDAMTAPVRAYGSDSWRGLATMIAFSMIGNTVLVVQPMVVGAFVDLMHFTERQAGVIAAAELLGFSVAAGALLTFVHRVNRRRLALVGVAMLAVTDLASCFVVAFTPMLVLRFIAGAAAAIAYAVFPVMAAASRKPERVFGVVNATSIAYAGIFVWIAPLILRAWGMTGIFLTMAAIVLAVCPTILWAPAVAAQPAPRAESNLNAIAGPDSLSLRLSIGLMLAMLFALYVGHGGIWAYQERIGAAAGLSSHQVGDLLGSSMLIWGVAGSLLATLLGLRIGRVWPQVVSIALSIGAAALLVLGVGPWPYGIASALIAASWFYGLPYQCGLLAFLDPGGRANIAADLVSTLGSSAGPAIAAALIGQNGHRAIGVMAGICYVLCLALALLSIHFGRAVVDSRGRTLAHRD